MPIARGQRRTFSRARDDRLGCFASDRSQQALHDGVLRRAELSEVLFSEAETCQRAQTGLGRQTSSGIARAYLSDGSPVNWPYQIWAFFKQHLHRRVTVDRTHIGVCSQLRNAEKSA